MKIKNFILVSVITLFVSIISHPTDVLACDCDIPESALEALERADVVFTGVVQKKKEEKIDGEMYDAILIQVSKVWKGLDDTQVIVHTDWSDCNFGFQEGEEYLLYANDYNNKLNTSNCSRSSLYSEASPDLQELGEGKIPSHEVNLEDQFHTVNRSYHIMILLGVVLLFIIGGVIWKMKKK